MRMFQILLKSLNMSLSISLNLKNHTKNVSNRNSVVELAHLYLHIKNIATISESKILPLDNFFFRKQPVSID
jgi:hypothetical protein